MDSEALLEKVKNDVLATPEYRAELDKILVPPYSAVFEDIDGGELPLHIVACKDEFFIVYDGAAGRYGLAFRSILGVRTYLGEEGDLAETYHALINREDTGTETRRGDGDPRSGKKQMNASRFRGPSGHHHRR